MMYLVKYEALSPNSLNPCIVGLGSTHSNSSTPKLKRRAQENSRKITSWLVCAVVSGWRLNLKQPGGG